MRPAPWGDLSLRIAEHPLFTSFATHLAAGRGRATRLPPAAAAWVFDLVAERAGKPLVVVVPHESDAFAWLESLRLVAGEGVGGYFATPSLSPYQEAEASLDGARPGGHGARRRARRAACGRCWSRRAPCSGGCRRPPASRRSGSRAATRSTSKSSRSA